MLRDKKKKASTASALAKMLRKNGIGSNYVGSTLGQGDLSIEVRGDGVFCVGAYIRYVGYFSAGRNEAEQAQQRICEVLDESGSYAHKAKPIKKSEGLGHTFWIHVESLRYVKSDEAEGNTCFPHLREK